MTKHVSKTFLISICLTAFISFFCIWYSLFVEKFSGNFDILELDVFINSSMTIFHDHEFYGFFTPVFIFATTVFDPAIFLTWFLLFIIFLWRKNLKFESLFLFFGVAGGQTIKIIIKYLTDRPRPENPFGLSAHESSFPSGHSTTAVFFFLAILYLFTGQLEKTQKILARGFLITGALLVPFSRVYEQVHYFSDVIAGSLLGIFSLSFTIIIFKLSEEFFPEIYKKIT
jgi:undecaprenyl-diphosphatase